MIGFSLALYLLLGKFLCFGLELLFRPLLRILLLFEVPMPLVLVLDVVMKLRCVLGLLLRRFLLCGLVLLPIQVLLLIQLFFLLLLCVFRLGVLVRLFRVGRLNVVVLSLILSLVM